jgi:PAS domain S-box-containing protein
MINIEQIVSKWSSATRYTLAFSFFIIALFVRLKIAPVEAGLPFMVFYPVMVVTFYLCGIGAGIFFVICSAISGYYLFTPPFFSFESTAIGVTTVSAFSISAAVIGLVISRMKHALYLLKQSEQQYHRLLEDQTETICRFKADNTLIYVNEAFCRLFNKSSEELIGHQWNPVIYPDDIQMVNDKLNRLSPSNPIVTIENRFIAGNGSIRWGQFVNHAFYDEQGALLETQGVGRDITQHKLAEIALADSEKEFRLLAEAMPHIVWITRADGWNIFFNQQWIDYTGLTLEESHGHGWNKPFHPDDQQRAWDAWQNAVNNNGIYSLECRLRRADGEYRWWLVRGVPVLDAEGKTYKWFGTCTDIHDMKMVENELTILSNRFNTAIAVSEIGIWDLNLLQYTVWRSLKHDQIFGYESLQPHWDLAICLQHTIPEDHNLVISAIEEARHTGVLSFECRIIQQNQAVHWINVRGRTFYDENAQPIQVIGVVEDITERKLLEQERMLAATIFEAQEGMFITDADKCILRVNTAFTHITGYTLQDVQNQTLHLFSSELHNRDFYVSMWQRINREGAWEREIWNHRKNSEIYPQYLVITAVKDSQGILTNYVGTFNDMSQLKSTEQKLLHSLDRQMQQEKMAAMGVLVGGVAHEINNPLMGILNYIEYAQQHIEEGRPREMLGKALKEVNRIARLVNSMLTFAHQPSSDMPFCDLLTTLNPVLNLIEGDFKKAEISVHLDVPENFPQLGINADSLEQILLNLLVNAAYSLKNVATPRELQIMARQMKNDSIELLIRDNGSGVPTNLRHKIFDPFFTTKPLGEGTGLGLAMSRQLAEASNGKLELVESSQGACFKLGLPKLPHLSVKSSEII